LHATLSYYLVSVINSNAKMSTNTTADYSIMASKKVNIHINETPMSLKSTHSINSFALICTIV